MGGFRLESGLHVSNQVVSLGVLLDTGEDHLGARDILLGVLKVLEKSLLGPDNALADVASRVRVTSGLASLAAEEAVQVGALLVGSTSLDSVALSALGLEDLGTFLNVSHFRLTGLLVWRSLVCSAEGWRLGGNGGR